MKHVKPITLKRVRDLLNSYDDEKLDSVALWWGEERGGTIKTISPLDEDYVLTQEGYEPLSAFKDEKNPEDYYDVKNTLPKGTPIIWVD